MPDYGQMAADLMKYMSPDNKEWAPWPVKLARSVIGAVALPGDVYSGKVPVTGEDGRSNPEVINRAAELAALAQGGTFASAPVAAGEFALGAGIPRQAFTKDGSVRTGWVMRDVERYPNEPGANRLRSRAAEPEIAELPIRSLTATQHMVNPDFASASANSAARADGFNLPAVFKYGGKYYVGDGHHRIVAAAEKGDTAKVRLFDLEPTPRDPAQMALPFGVAR